MIVLSVIEVHCQPFLTFSYSPDEVEGKCDY